MLLDGKVAVVTGASRGLGKAIATKFAENGAMVVLVATNRERLMENAESIKSAGGKADFEVCDLTKDADVFALMERIVQKHGSIDILVNNAGISKEMPLLEMPVEVFDEIMNVNFRTVMLVTKAALPYMVKQQCGNIVNIASAAALRGLPGSSAYSASKAAVVCLSQTLGDELRPHHIRVNVVCPGPVDTELFQKSAKRDFILAAGGDVFSPETVADGVLYLASDLSKGMSSQTLTIRGFNRW
jgi:NAD(P)-dependent dehydrogenase (short-subunit alcohol dehydrogenase family)